MNSIMPDLRYGLRQLRKTPTFALTAIVTLARGIGANTAIFTVFHQVMLRMLPVEKPDELVRLTYTGTFKGRMSIFGGDVHDFFSYPMYRELRDSNSVFSGLLANTEVQVGAVWKDQPELVNAEVVSGNYFDVLGVGAAVGRTFAGIAVAIPLAVMLARWMRSELFGVQPFDPVTRAGCIALTVAMVLVAAALPARRAASVEPTKALRTE
jgi:hypothetical protein